MARGPPLADGRPGVAAAGAGTRPSDGRPTSALLARPRCRYGCHWHPRPPRAAGWSGFVVCARGALPPAAAGPELRRACPGRQRGAGGARHGPAGGVPPSAGQEQLWWGHRYTGGNGRTCSQQHPACAAGQRPCPPAWAADPTPPVGRRAQQEATAPVEVVAGQRLVLCARRQPRAVVPKKTEKTKNLGDLGCCCCHEWPANGCAAIPPPTSPAHTLSTTRGPKPSTRQRVVLPKGGPEEGPSHPEESAMRVDARSGASPSAG